MAGDWTLSIQPGLCLPGEPDMGDRRRQRREGINGFKQSTEVGHARCTGWECGLGHLGSLCPEWTPRSVLPALGQTLLKQPLLGAQGLSFPGALGDEVKLLAARVPQPYSVVKAEFLTLTPKMS